MKIAGVVLAGGLSTRMGQDKAQLRLAEQSLLARNVALLSTLPLAQVYVSGHYPDYTCISDLNATLGPIGGLHACGEYLYKQYDAMFIIPVDMPLLSDVDCLHLMQQFTQYPQGVFYAQATFPMLLPLNRAVKAYLCAAVTATANKQRSLYRMLNTLNVHAISTPPAQAYRFQNSNTPEQWADCVATYHALNSSKEKQ